MEFMLIVYLISTVLPLLKGLAFAAGGIAIFCLIMGPLFYLILSKDMSENQIEVCKSVAKKVFIGWCIAMTFHLVPDEKTSYAMLAAYTTQQVVTNDKVQEIAGQSLETVELLLQKYNQELKDKVKTKEDK